MTSKELFSSAALRSALHAHLRGLEAQHLETFLASFRTLPWVFVTDVLSTFLEPDVKREGGSKPDSECSGPYNAPSSSHLFTLLSSPGPSSIKISLFTLLRPRLTWEQPSEAIRQSIITTFRDDPHLATVEALLDTL